MRSRRLALAVRGTGLRRAVAALLAVACCLMPRGARAVDRSAGASVTKPAAAGAPWTRRQKRRLARDLDALLDAAPALRGAHAGLLLLDARSGAVVYARNAGDAFVPASTMKLLTGSAALALLGPAFRFHTEASVAPPSAALYVRAGGDPLLTGADVLELARAASGSGAFRFPYRAVVDERAFDAAPYPPGWSWDDLGYDYAAPLSPLPVDENAAEVTVSSGAGVGTPLVVHQSDSAAAAFAGTAPPECPAALGGRGIEPAVTGPAASIPAIDAVAVPPAGCVAVTGSLPAGGAAQTLGIARLRPRRYFAALAGAVAGDGIAGAAPPGAQLVWTHDGEPLTDLLADMWWPSDNFVAEMLLRAIGLQRAGEPGTTGHGAAAEGTWLASIGVDPAPLTIADGSGLSSYDRVTPAALCAVLQNDWNAPYRDVVLDDLPLAGVRGTLAAHWRGSLAERRTFAKTGSMNHARALAGYLAAVRHGALTFAWLVDDWPGADAELDALRGALLSRIIGD